jgi:hypothetical protein
VALWVDGLCASFPHNSPAVGYRTPALWGWMRAMAPRADRRRVHSEVGGAGSASYSRPAGIAPRPFVIGY